ncbi:MAG: PIG-L family deacetylase [Thermoanaerobaculia bacterium]
MRPIRFLATIVAILLPTLVYARDAAEIQLALRKLNVVGSALYVAAHPDDENTAMLAWLAHERLLRTGYLSVTRGDGGQNLVGEEKGELLGILRTQELLSARRIDGAEQLFTRAIDFGYSKSADETLKIWGHDAVLADFVVAIRRFQPDVIVSRFPVTGEGGHGQHTASAILAEEAFTAAADAARFPESTYGPVWKPSRIFWNRFSWRQVDPNDPALAKSLRIDLGTYNPLLGRAYTELAGESRTMHKSQGFGSAERRGTLINYLDLRAGTPATTDPFEGIDTSWARYPGGETVGAALEKASDEFDPTNPAASLPALLTAWDALDRLQAMPEWSGRRNPWITVKREELRQVISDCAGISIDVSASASTVVAGGEIPISVTVLNRSDHPFRLAAVGSIYAIPGKAPGTLLENNRPVKTDLVLRVPAEFDLSQPYWLRKPPSPGLYTVEDQRLIGRPENRPLTVNVALQDGGQRVFIATVPVVYRWTDRVLGEKTRDVTVVPPATANVRSPIYVFPDSQPRTVSVHLHSFDAKTVSVRLIVPQGWKAEPLSHAVEMDGPGDERRAQFKVTPPQGDSVGHALAEVTLPDGKTVSVGLTDIDYEHINPQRVFGDAATKLVRTDVKKRGSRVGYIMGSGDAVPNILRQIGYEVVLLTDDDLDRGDFAKLDAIVAGIRAYNTRPRIKLAHEKLMQYVANGGTMVTQYNTSGDELVKSPGPYPLELGRDRVTVEGAPVTFVDPSSPLLNAPNRITPDDFDGWVQERGLYFAGKWDPKYAPLFSTADPGEDARVGSTLVARHGKGVFVYTSLAWWRQLPAGVPGAIRMFTNLVSAR